MDEANLPAMCAKRKEVWLIKIFFATASKNKAHGDETSEAGESEFWVIY